ncbi:uncharacterized protein LOC129605260 [Condylostylus longicornis]|uniref:uncharacterized protein LOC129605260 n=1 Tax=Condylostylus longicornis TaxID=2530218 RepID=UPI00244E4DB6|nr:uncharacterized protein LOC129605260 [Condylostylus longicornis]
MSLKIEPITKKKTSIKGNQILSSKKTGTFEHVYKFLQKTGFSSKLKKPCSKRTCDTKELQCRQILQEQRNLINHQFWIEMNPNERLNYIIKNTTLLNPDIEPYFSTNLTITGQCYAVCKKMFLSTLSLIEKNVMQILFDDFQKNECSRKEKSSKTETNTPKIKPLKKNVSNTKKRPHKSPRSSEDEASNQFFVPKIEYVEVEAELVDEDISEMELDFEDKIEEASLKKTVEKPNRKKRVTAKKERVKNKKETRKWRVSMDSASENEFLESSDESWKEDVHSNSPVSGSDVDDSEGVVIEAPTIKTEKRSKRASKKDTSAPAYNRDISTPVSLKKPKIEPQSDLENINSSSEDDNFSNVEDTDDSDNEEINKTQTQIIQDEGDEYSDGISLPEKMGPPCTSELCAKLKNRSCKNIKELQREELFHEFWNEKSYTDRKFYVKQNVEILEQKGRPKNITPLIYNITIDSKKLEVCQKLFHSTFALRVSCVLNWVHDRNSSDFYNANDVKNFLDPLDTPKTLKARKRFENYAEKLQLLEDFLNSLEKMPPKSFPQQKSHKFYLTEEIEGLRNLQRLYKNVMISEGIKNPLPVKILKKVFCAKHYTFYTGYKKRNAKFKTIDDSEITPEVEEAMKRDQQERQRDKILTKRPGSYITVLDIDTCDGKVSPNWNGDGEESDTNSRLCCFNLTISNVITLHTYNYWFCEIDALDTTPSSFITCLMDYFTNFCKTAKQIIIYCRIGDNRFKSIDMTNGLLDYAITNKLTITQKFYIPRKHLYKDETECQSVYRSLYRKLRRFEINLPSDYVTATIDCKREPMEAKWVHFNQFRDYSFNSKKHRYYNLTNDPDEFNNIKSILCKQDGTVSIKMDFDDTWVLLSDNLKCKSITSKAEWPQLYCDRRKISAVKYQLLQSLKVKLPKDCHFFYDYLTIEI